MDDKKIINFYSRMDRPIPGEGLTSNPDSPWPWEKPPRFTSVIEASEYMFDEFIDEDMYPMLMDALEDETPVMDLTRFLLFKGFTEGLWNPDLLVLLIEPTAYILIALAERALIDPVIYNEENEDEAMDMAETVLKKESLDMLRNYSAEEGIPEGALSKDIEERIQEIPEGRPSLLERPTIAEERSLLEGRE